MYLVPVVQCGRLSASLHGRQHTQPACNRSTCADATNGREAPGVVVVHEMATQAVAPNALSSQATSRTATLPWLRQIAVLVRGPNQQRLPSVVAHCSPGEGSSVSVLTAPAASSTWSPTGLDGPDPLVIHLPGADGTSEGSPADPASGGLPSTPAMVSDSSSLALRQPTTVQRSQEGQLGLRPGSGSRTLPSMRSTQRGSVALSSAAVSEAPATAAPESGNLQVKLPGPLGFLSFKQWGSNSNGVYWGSPIGGTLYINPPVEDAAPVCSNASAPQHQQRQLGSSTKMFWGSPIGGTLYINPPVEEANMFSAPQEVSPTPQPSKANRSFWGSPIGGTLYINPPVEEVAEAPSTPQQAQQTTSPSQHSKGSSGSHWGSPIGGTLYINPPVHDAPVGSTAAAVMTDGPVSASNVVGSSAAAQAKRSKLPFLPPFQWGGNSRVQWGSPIGGTLYINPQAPADWHDGAWGSSGFGSSSGGNGGGNGSSNGRGPGAGSSGGSALGVKSKPGNGVGAGGTAGKQQPNVAYASIRAGLGGVPLGVGLARLGIALMAATAAAAVAVYLKAAPASSPNSSMDVATVLDRSGSGGSGSPAASPSAAAVVGPAPAGATEGLGFHQWMVSRLQSTLESFEAEQSMLRTELAVLNSIPAGSGFNKLGMLGGLKRWLGGTSSSSRPDGAPVGLSEAAATAAAVSGGATRELSAADVMARVSELQEQLDSIDVLKAALSAELAEQQQLLQKAKQEQQSTQEQLAALAGR